MTFGIRIATFNAQAQSTEHCFRSLQLIGEFLELDQRLDSCKEFFRENGFAEEIVCACLDAASTVFALAQASDQNERNEASRRIVLQFTAKFVTGLPWHDHI